MKNTLWLTLLFWLSFSLAARAQEAGDIVSVNQNQIHFFIGKVDVKSGEQLDVTDPAGQVVLKVLVTQVEPPYADATLIGYISAATGMIEPLSTIQKVRLNVDPKKASSVSFFVGPDFAPKVGGFGGVNYSLGVSIVAPIKRHWLMSLQLQADDLGKDSSGTGKRISYYMFGFGRRYRGFQAFVHVGVTDYMTMPAGGKTVIDPYTHAAYPDNVEHSDKFGFLLAVKYPFPIKVPNRDSDWGWSVAPMLTYGGAFSGHYQPTAAAMVSFDFLRVF